MALTYKESQLVKATIPFLREQGETVSDVVYSTLIKRHPQLNNTLNLVHLKDGRLARALTVVILRFASNINNVYELIPKFGKSPSARPPPPEQPSRPLFSSRSHTSDMHGGRFCGRALTFHRASLQ